MSAKNKKKATTGTRYTPAQKQEVVDFVNKYNSENGRGGQTAANKKFKITQLTIAAWMKKSKGGVKKTAKPKAASPKTDKPTSGPNGAKGDRQSGRGVRYTDERKQEVLDFVAAHNAERGRGGQNRAAQKFGLSVLTVSNWIKSAGQKSSKGAKTKVAKAAKVAPVSASATSKSSSGLVAQVALLIETGELLQKADAEAAKLRAKYESLRASIQAIL